jgi:hypothetical protein
MARSNKDETTRIDIPLNQGFSDRLDDTELPPGLNAEVVNLRYVQGESLPARPPRIRQTATLTWTTQSIAPGAVVPPVGTVPGIACFRPDIGHRSFTRDTTQRVMSTLVGPLTGASNPNAWFPAQVVNSRSPFQLQSLVPNMSVQRTTSGHLVSVGYNNSARAITVSVEGSDGRVLMQPTFVDAGPAPLQLVIPNPAQPTPYPIALTRHSSDRVALWYYRFTGSPTPPLVVRVIDCSGTVPTISAAETTVVTPVVKGPFAVSSIGDDEFAYIAHADSTTNTVLSIRKFSITSLTTTTSTTLTGELSAAGLGDTPLAISAHGEGSTRRVATTWVSASILRGDVREASDLSSVSSAATRGLTTCHVSASVVGVSWMHLSCSGGPTTSGFEPVWFHSNRELRPVVGSDSTAWTEVTVGAASSYGTFRLGGLTLASHPQAWSFNTLSGTLPIVPLSRVFRSGSVPGDAGFVYDTSIELYAMNHLSSSTSFTASPIARLGVESAYMVGRWPWNSLSIRDNVATFAYPTTDLEAGAVTTNLATPLQLAESMRVTDVALWSHITASTHPGMPDVVTSPGSAGIVACAQPVFWDGREIVEVGYLHQPFLSASSKGGTTPFIGNLPADTYGFCAVASHIDALGETHRSAPSLRWDLTTSGSDDPMILISKPDTMRDGRGLGLSRMEVYGSDGTDPTLYLISNATFSNVRDTPGYWHIMSVLTGSVLAGQRAVYTNGAAFSELQSEAPGAMWSACAVGDRIWYVDAENRSRLRFSKRKVAGLTWEFNNSSLFVELGAQAGRAIAIRELDGRPHVFCEEGIYTFYGEGPDNTLNGQGFSPPQLVSNVRVNPRCRSTIVRTPQGILFETLTGHAVLLPGGQVQELPKVRPTNGRRLSALHSQRNGEAFLFNTDGAQIQCTQADVWTRWAPGVLSGSLPVAACIVPGHVTGSAGAESMVLFTSGAMWTVDDTDDNDHNSQWIVETGWIAPVGDIGETSFQHVVIDGVMFSSGSTLTMREAYDFDPSWVSTVTWSASEVTASSRGVGTKATMALQCTRNQARSIKLAITGSSLVSGSGFIPRTLSVIHTPITDWSLTWMPGPIKGA